jgi:hypothetical protein
MSIKRKCKDYLSALLRSRKYSSLLVIVVVVAGIGTYALVRSLAASGGDTLASGDTLTSGQAIVSSLANSTNYRAVMQGTGIFELFNPDGKLIWKNLCSGTSSGASITMESSGNLIEYNGSTEIWSSGTSGSSYKLVMEPSGILAILNSSGKVVWSVSSSSKCGSGSAGPTIDSFTADPTTVDSGQRTTLKWTTSNVKTDGCSIDNGDGDITTGLAANDSKGKYYTPPNDRIYTLTCEASDKVTTYKTVSVTVKQSGSLPKIDSFTADPTKVQYGNSTKLTWTTSNVKTDGCSIDNGDGGYTDNLATNGSKTYTPPTNRTYVLTCTDSNGNSVSAKASVTVTVITTTGTPVGTTPAPPATTTPIFGLSFSNTDNGAAQADIAHASDYSEIAGPSSLYPARQIRLNLDYTTDIASLNTDIQDAESYAQNLNNPTTNPVVVSMNLSNADVNNFDSSAGCNSALVLSCRSAAETLVSKVLPTLMADNTQVKYWTVANEPDDGNKPTNATEGADPNKTSDQAYLAASLWTYAAKQAVQYGDTVLAGEFANSSGTAGYVKNYMSDLATDATANVLPAPSAWAVHLYGDVSCGRNPASSDSNIYQFIQALKNYKVGATSLYTGVQQGSGIWVTEAATDLASGGPNTPPGTANCPNAGKLGTITTSNDQPENTADITESDISKLAASQTLSAQTFMTLYTADKTIPFHTFWYTPAVADPQCFASGDTDYDLWAPDGAKFSNQVNSAGHTFSPYADTSGNGSLPGNARPSFYVLTGQPVPNYTTSMSLQQAALTLIPAAFWTPPSGNPPYLTNVYTQAPAASPSTNCYYGLVTPNG